MRAMLLAAGLGTRLRPLTYRVSKSMIPVINKPSLFYSLNLLRKSKINETVINLYHQGSQIKDYVKDGEKFNVQVLYSEEDSLMGTAGGLKKMESYFKDTFLVLSADGITDFNIHQAVQFHKQKAALATVVLKKTEEKFRYGVALRNKQGKITQFMEKPSWGDALSDEINAGIYIFEPGIFSYIPAGEPYDLGHQVLPSLVKRGEAVYGYLMDDYWIDMGNLGDYMKVHRDILKGKTGIKISGREIKKGIWIGENVQISKSASLKPPVVIGNNCRIEEKVAIGKYTTLGDRVTIKKEARLEKCILWDDVLIEEKAYLDNCILTHFARIPPKLSITGGVVTHRIPS